MTTFARLLARILAACALVVAITTSPALAQDAGYSGTLGPLNDSGASGDITVSVEGTTVTVTATVNNVVDLVHAQHLHGEFDFENSCPGPDLDEDGDGVISTAEGVPNYGTVKLSLTTDGGTDSSYALAVESFPVGSGGSYTYTRSFEVDQETADGIGDLLFVVHGFDKDGSGEYDGDAVSSLSDDLPLEATMPIACAQLVATGATPAGAVAAGAGGSAQSTTSAAPFAFAFAAIVIGGSAFALTRGRRLR